MNVPVAVLQFALSLLAVLALAWTARRLRLGPPARFADEAAARAACEAAVPGYRPAALALDRDGAGAIARDGAGRVLVLRPHGSHFAGRLLGPAAQARIAGDRLEIDTAEARFGTASLALGDAAAWLRAIAERG